MTEPELDLVERLSVLELRPGDVLVLTYADEITAAQAERLRGLMAESLPGYPCVVLSGGVELGALRLSEASS